MASDPADKEKPDEEARAREKGSDQKDSLEASREKVPEGEGNLRRRADWFQKRTGGTE